MRMGVSGVGRAHDRIAAAEKMSVNRSYMCVSLKCG